MQLGLPWWIGAGEPEDGIDEAARTGYDFVEISLDAPWPEGIEPLALADRADDQDVSIGIHGPWRTQALAHPREELAQAAREVAQSCVAAARAAEADYIVFHVDAPGYRGHPRADVVEHGLETAHASLRALSRSAGDELAILVENTTSPMGTPAEIAAFLEPLPDVGFCLDPGHAMIHARRDEESPAWDPGEWSQATGDAWTLTHLMDVLETDEGIRDHLMPGSGEADISAILDQARSVDADRVLVEAFSTGPEGHRPETGDWREARKLIEDRL